MTTPAQLLLVDDDTDLLRLLTMRLTAAGHAVQAVSSAEAALAHLAVRLPSLVITDVRLPGLDGLALFDEIRQRHPSLPVILLTAHGSIPDAVEATTRGAHAYLTKPFDGKELLGRIQQALRVNAPGPAPFDGDGEWRREIISRSPRMAEVLAEARLVAGTDASVLIAGESGSGKELLARAIHKASPRAARPFVAVNCAAIPEALLESELFGHVKGAFTGAQGHRQGLIPAAHGGTVFLDEIGDMPMALQIKLLRVLQERRVERLGSNEELPVNVRFIAASKSDLKEQAARGEFRSDLYYRLNIATLSLPPLRERREDIPLLFEHFVAQACARYERGAPELTPEKLRELMAHDWPGNVREIRNAADRFVLALDDLDPQAALQAMPSLPLSKQMDLVEKTLIEQALRRTQGKVPAAMELLGTPRKTLYDKLHRHGIVLDDFR